MSALRAAAVAAALAVLPAGQALAAGTHAPAVAVLFVHGGGWLRADANTDETRFARQLATATGWTVDVASYTTRTAPYRTTEIGDVAARLRDLVARTGADRVVLWGESAGANLAEVVAYRHPRLVDAVVAVSGPTDMAAEWRTVASGLVTRYEQATPQTAPGRYERTSPLRAGRPVATFQAVGGDDPLVPAAQIVALDRRLAAAGVAHRRVVVAGTADHATALEYDRAGRRTVAQLAVAFVTEETR